MQFQFNARQYAPIQGAEQWPDGWYKLVITGHDMKRTQANDGTRLVLNVTAQDGAYAGKVNFIGLNIENKNPTAVQMAYETLAAICWVCNRPAINDVSELHGIPFYAACTKSEQGNNWRVFKDVNGQDAVNIAGANGGTTQRQQQPPQQQGGFGGGQPGGGFPQPGGQPQGQWQQQPPAQQTQQPSQGQQPWQGGQPQGQGQWQPPGAGAPPAGGPPAGQQPQWSAPPAGSAPPPAQGGWNAGPSAGAAPPPAQGWQPGGAPAAGAAPPWGAQR